MLGLIKKDLLIIKGNIKVAILFVIVFALMSSEGNEILYFVPVFLSTMLFMSTFSYDDYNKWDAYACTFPSGRANIVKAKYSASLILTFVAIIITYILGIVMGSFNNNLDFSKINSIICGVLFAMILLQSIMFPLLFKFGAEKGRIGLFIGVILITSLLGLILNSLTIKIPGNVIKTFNDYWFIILPLIMIIMLFISYKISRKIYLNKEF